MTVLSALPILVPLVGVPVCFLPLYPLFGRLSRRAVYAVLLSGTALSLLLVWSSSSSAVIPVPSDAGYFFSSGDYKNIRYGKDFIDWYNQGRPHSAVDSRPPMAAYQALLPALKLAA